MKIHKTKESSWLEKIAKIEYNNKPNTANSH